MLCTSPSESARCYIIVDMTCSGMAMKGQLERSSNQQLLSRPVCCAEPCNLRGDCQTNNTCYCTNGWKTCVPNDGTVTSASAGCETYVYDDDNNCGECGNVSISVPSGPRSRKIHIIYTARLRSSCIVALPGRCRAGHGSHAPPVHASPLNFLPGSRPISLSNHGDFRIQ